MKQLLVQEGEIAKVGAGLCLIEAEQDDDQAHDPESSSEVSATPAPEGMQDPAVATRERIEEDAEAEASVQRIGNKHPLDPTNTASTSSMSDHALATPSVRHFARQHGLDISVLAPGSGREGRVEKKDVEAFIAKGRIISGSEAGPANQAVQAEDKDVLVELGRTRYGMWKAMTQVGV